MSRLKNLREGLKRFYERHDILIDTIGSVTFASVVTYGLGVAFLVICKKLGLTNQ